MFTISSISESDELDSDELVSEELLSDELDSDELDSNELDSDELDSDELDSDELLSADDELDSDEVDLGGILVKAVRYFWSLSILIIYVINLLSLTEKYAMCLARSTSNYRPLNLSRPCLPSLLIRDQHFLSIYFHNSFSRIRIFRIVRRIGGRIILY
jgi:hypothetical protein